MSIFNWNPIRRNLKDVNNRTEFTKQPIIFLPRNYVRQQKRSLYNNLLILLGGLWALTISHDMDIFETEARVKLKKILGSSGLVASHLVAVPLIICKLNLHYSIILGAIGMSVTSFFYSVKNPLILSIVICSRIIFVGLFDVGSMIYIVKLARITSKIQGNAIYSQVLIARSFTTIFDCTANIMSSAWRRYTQESAINESVTRRVTTYCPWKLLKKSRFIGTLTIGLNTIFVAVSIVVALSGVILITMYLKPIGNLGNFELSKEPKISNPYRILKQFAKPKAKQLAIMIMICVLMREITDDFVLAYVTCKFSLEYSFYAVGMKELSMIFGAMSCVTVVDFTGFYWLYEMALLCQFSSYFCLVLWQFSLLKTQLSYLIVYHILCASVSVETSILQLFVVQTLGDEEVSAWCFYYFVSDAIYLLCTISEFYLTMSVKLWILIGVGPLAMITVAMYSYKIHEKTSEVCLNESCSLLLKTSRKNIAESSTFDLKIAVEKFDDIRKIETLLERRFTLKSRSLVPPKDAKFSATLLRVDEP